MIDFNNWKLGSYGYFDSFSPSEMPRVVGSGGNRRTLTFKFTNVLLSQPSDSHVNESISELWFSFGPQKSIDLIGDDPNTLPSIIIKNSSNTYEELDFEDFRIKFVGKLVDVYYYNGIWNHGIVSSIFSNSYWDSYWNAGKVAMDNMSFPYADTIEEYFNKYFGMWLYVKDNPLCYLYCNESNDNVKGKSLYLEDFIAGEFTEEVDILNPSILLNTDLIFQRGGNPHLPHFNYIYLPAFGRYYYVMGIINIRQNMYRINCKVDVLNSWENEISDAKGFITRRSDLGNNYLFDNRYPLENIKTIKDLNLANYNNPTYNAVNTSFVVDDSVNIENMILTAYITTPIANLWTDVDSPFDNDHTIVPTRPYSAIAYCGSSDFIRSMAGSLFNNSALASYVQSVVFFPFDLNDTNTFFSGQNVQIGNLYWDGGSWVSSSSGVITSDTLSEGGIGYAIIGDYLFDSDMLQLNLFDTLQSADARMNFLLYEPYTSYEMYLPFVGWVKLNSVDIIDKNIMVYYAVDYSTGSATAYIVQYKLQRTTTLPVTYKRYVTKIIASYPCQLGVKFPISVDNQEEITRTKENNTRNLALGLISSGVSLGIGAAAANPVAIVGGVLSGAKTIAAAMNADNMLLERAQCSFASSDTAYYQDLKIHIKVTYRMPIINTDSGDSYTTYEMMNGHPCQVYADRLGDEIASGAYVEISEMYLAAIQDSSSDSFYPTKTEIEEIKSLAKNGIIF